MGDFRFVKLFCRQVFHNSDHRLFTLHSAFSDVSSFEIKLRFKEHQRAHLAHLSDGIIKHTASIISSFAEQLDFPGTRWKSQISWVQLHDLTGYLYQDWLCLLSSEHKNITDQGWIRVP